MTRSWDAIMRRGLIPSLIVFAAALGAAAAAGDPLAGIAVLVSGVVLVLAISGRSGPAGLLRPTRATDTEVHEPSGAGRPLRRGR
jgi:hypothetical protein